jgi:hypothetical protein
MAIVEVYHVPKRGASVDDLLAEGLKSRKQLIKEGKLEPLSSSGLFEDHLSTIYFQWFPPHLEANRENCDWVSTEVNPETTDVFNREFRYHNDRGKYKASRMSLTDYISQHEKTKELRKDLEPGKMIVWNPLTAEPTVVGVDDRRVSDSRWQYLNEIIFQKPVVPASELKGHYKARSE